MSEPFEALMQVYGACEGLPISQRLEILQLAWSVVAGNARVEASITPGGFSTERARQVGVLREMAQAVSHDEPDPEVERLYYEGNTEGLLRRVWNLLDGPDGRAELED